MAAGDPNAVYKEHGFADRQAYLDSLAEDYGRENVEALTGVLPASEDFDLLVTSLEDGAEGELDG